MFFDEGDANPTQFEIVKNSDTIEWGIQNGFATARAVGGGSRPSLSFGPYVCGAISEGVLLRRLTASDLGLSAGTWTTVGIRVVGYAGDGESVSYVRDCRATMVYAGGAISSPQFATGSDITIGVTESIDETWTSVVRIASDELAIEVIGACALSASRWRVQVWTLDPYSLGGVSDVAAQESITVTVPRTVGTNAVPLTWVATPGVDGFAAWEGSSAEIPLNQAFSELAPDSVILLSGGLHHLHFAGRHASGFTAVQSADVIATNDAIAPTITSFTLEASAASLDVDVLTLEASEEGCEVRLYQGATPTGVWTPIASVTSVHCAGSDSQTVNCQVRDAVGNVQSTIYSASTTITITDTTPPTLTTCALAATATSTTVPLTLAASESGCEVQCYQGATPSGDWTAIGSVTSFTFPADDAQSLNVRVRDAAGNTQTIVYTANTTITVSENTLFFEDEFVGAAGAAPGWVTGTQYTGQAVLSGNGTLVCGTGAWDFGIVRNGCGGSIPADDYCVTFAAPGATFGGSDLGLAICVTESGGSISGVNAWAPNSSGAPTLRSGQPLTNQSPEMTTVVTGTVPASWNTNAAQLLLTLRAHTVGGVRRLTMYLNGHEYSHATETGGYFEGAGATAGTGIAIDGLQAQSKTFDYVRVTRNPPVAS